MCTIYVTAYPQKLSKVVKVAEQGSETKSDFVFIVIFLSRYFLNF